MHMCVKTDQCTFLASEFVPLIKPGGQSSSLPIVSGKSLIPIKSSPASREITKKKAIIHDKRI